MTSGSDLPAALASKDAELARMASELSRQKRQIAEFSNERESLKHEVEKLTQQLQDVTALNRANERKNVMTVVSNRDDRAQLHKLESEVGAKAQQVARLEAELAAQAKASELRLTELQDTFAAKLGDLKATHQAQLAAQQVDADAAKAGLEAQVSALRQQLSQPSAHQEQEASRQAAAYSELRQSLEGSEARCKSLQAENDRLRRESSTLAVSLAALQEKHDALAAAQHGAAASGSRPEASAPDVGMLSMMEGQLARLSDIIRAREAEVAQLRLTVQAGCDERRELVAQIDQLSKVAAAGSSPGAAGGAAAAAADSKSPLVRSTVGGMPLRGAPPPQRQAPPLPAKGRFR